MPIELQNAAMTMLAGYTASGIVLPGTLMNIPGNTLPPNFLWPDRTTINFGNWPELKLAYDAGILKVLPYTATPEEMTANPFSWVELEDESGLVLPDVGNLFPRSWRPNQTERIAGSKQDDAIRNITGRAYMNAISSAVANDPVGALDAVTYSSTKYAYVSGGIYYGADVILDTSWAVPTADENRPVNYAQPVAIFMGEANTNN